MVLAMFELNIPMAIVITRNTDMNPCFLTVRVICRNDAYTAGDHLFLPILYISLIRYLMSLSTRSPTANIKSEEFRKMTGSGLEPASISSAIVDFCLL